MRDPQERVCIESAPRHVKEVISSRRLCIRLFHCFVATMPLLLASCGTSGTPSGGNPKVTRENFAQIQTAMTNKEVESILGQPDRREDGPLVDGNQTRFSIYRGVSGEEIRVQIRVLFTTTNQGIVVDKSFIAPGAAPPAASPLPSRPSAPAKAVSQMAAGAESSAAPAGRKPEPESTSPPPPPPQGEIEALEEFTYEGLVKRMGSMKRKDLGMTAEMGRVSSSEFLRQGRTGRASFTDSTQYEDPQSGLVVSQTQTRVNVATKLDPSSAESQFGRFKEKVTQESSSSSLEFSRGSDGYRGAFHGGQRSGSWMRRHANRKPRVLGEYAGQRDGLFRCYDETGRPVWEGIYEAGNLVRAKARAAGGSLRGELTVLAAHEHPVAQFAFSPDGRRLAAAGSPLAARQLLDASRHAVQVWNTDDWTEVAVLPHEGDLVSELRFSPDGVHLATFDRGGKSARVWNVSDGRLVFQFQPVGSGTALVTGGPAASASGISTAFTPDGRYFACVAQFPFTNEVLNNVPTKGVQIVDLQRGEVVLTIPGCIESRGTQSGYATCECRSVAFNADGTLLAAGAAAFVRVYQWPSRKPLRQLTVYDALAMKFAPDNRSLFVIAHDASLLRCSLEDGQVVQLREPRDSRAAQPASFFSPDGRFLWQAARRIEATELATGELLFQSGELSRWAVSPTWLYWAAREKMTIDKKEQDMLVVRSSYSGDTVATLPDQETPVFSPDGRMLASLTRLTGRFGSNTVRIQDVLTRAEHTLPESWVGFVAFAFSPRQPILVTSDRLHDVSVWDLGKTGLGEKPAVADNRPPTVAIQQVPEGVLPGEVVTVVATGQDADGDPVRFQFRLKDDDPWQLDEDGRIRFPVPRQGAATVAVRAFDGRGGYSDIARASLKATTNPWAEWKQLHAHTLGSAIPQMPELIVRQDKIEARRSGMSEEQPYGCLSFSPDGKVLVAYAGKALRAWKLDKKVTSSVVKSYPELCGAGTFSPDGRLFFCGTEQGTIHFWDVAKGVLKTTPEAEATRRRIHCVVISPDGATLASGGEDKSITLWSVPERRRLKSYPPGPHNIISLAFSSDGARLAFTDDQSVGVLNASDGQSVWKHDVRIPGKVLYSKDETLLYRLESFADQISVWRAASGEQLPTISLATTMSSDGTSAKPRVRSMTEDDWNATDMALTPDGTTMAVGTTSGAVLIVRLSDGKRLRSFRGPMQQVFAVAFSPDGQLLVSSGKTSIQFWGVEGAIPPMGDVASPAAAPDMDAPQESEADTRAMRTWKDNTGKHSIRAEFLGLQGVRVRLRKEDGKTIWIPLSGLSREDQDWVRNQRRP